MKSLLARSLVVAAAVLTFSQVASAHPGHGPETGLGSDLAHPFSGLDHLLAMIAVGALAVRMGGRALWALPATFVVLMIAGGFLPLANVHIPLAEQTVAASVIALGVLLTTAGRIPTAAVLPLVVFFAIFHGYVHVLEMPLNQSAVAYASGFVLATATLHAIGIALEMRMRNRSHGSAMIRAGGAAIAVCGALLLATA
jgi:urease accessory protein